MSRDNLQWRRQKAGGKRELVRLWLTGTASAIWVTLCLAWIATPFYLPPWVGHLAVVWLAAWFVIEVVNSKRSPTRPRILVLAAYTAFHLVPYWLSRAGLDVTWFFPSFLDTAYAVSACVGVALAWGLTTGDEHPAGRLWVAHERRRGGGATFAVALGLVAISGATIWRYYASLGGTGALLTAYQASLLRTSAYENASTAFLGWGIAILRPAIAATIALGLSRADWMRNAGLLAWFAVGCWMVIAGDRSGLTLHLATALFIYERIKGPVRRGILVGAGILLILAHSSIKEFRGLKGDVGLIRAAAEGVSQATVQGLGRELSGTLDTVIRGLTVVEAEGWLGGESFLAAARRVVPNISGTPRDTIATASWVTARTAPATAAVGGGLGSSLCLECVANFGAPGGVIAAAILGWTLSRATRLAERRSAFWGGVWGAVVWAQALNAVRNEIGVLMRPVVIALLVVLVLQWLEQKTRLSLGRLRPDSVPRMSWRASQS